MHKMASLRTVIQCAVHPAVFDRDSEVYAAPPRDLEAAPEAALAAGPRAHLTVALAAALQGALFVAALVSGLAGGGGVVVAVAAAGVATSVVIGGCLAARIWAKSGARERLRALAHDIDAPVREIDLLHSIGRVVSIETPSEHGRRIVEAVIACLGAPALALPQHVSSPLIAALRTALSLESSPAESFFALRLDLALKEADPQTRDWARSIHGPMRFHYTKRALIEAVPDLDVAAAAAASNAAGFSLARFNVNVFAFADQNKGRALSRTMDWIVSNGSVGHAVQELGMQAEALVHAMAQLDSAYSASNSAVYHTSTHAADVVQCCFFLSTATPLAALVLPTERLALCLAAAFHDFRHPGRSNAFVIASDDDLSVRYSDAAVLERMHAAECWRLLRSIPGALPKACAPRHVLRELLTNIILSTDLANSARVVAEFSDHCAAAVAAASYRHVSDLLPRSDAPCAPKGTPKGARTNQTRRSVAAHFAGHAPQQSLVCMLVKFGDVSHAARPRALHLKWTTLLVTEFLSQGDEELACGRPASPLCDRRTLKLASAQLGFVDYIVRPIFEPVLKLASRVKKEAAEADAPETADAFADVVANLRTNYGYWKGLQAKQLDLATELRYIVLDSGSRDPGGGSADDARVAPGGTSLLPAGASMLQRARGSSEKSRMRARCDSDEPASVLVPATTY
ncbi:hypothetical protein M885DRAFT_516611 [Pelagophyceae sp. CCMP2097]|nr:hypothetical protein M885DRAFT_516611 [Pelagophyceae sp. CCMP2097]|mmetsp:Transcript_13719/g.45759  ORF Transcript_13719/g.45759 Transcript_13719/m.45759 type:complete len:686 (-) Transcript_13719:572-2629(-)